MGPGIYIMVCREKYASCKSIMSTLNIIINFVIQHIYIECACCHESVHANLIILPVLYILIIIYPTIIREKYTTTCIRYLFFAINVLIDI